MRHPQWIALSVYLVAAGGLCAEAGAQIVSDMSPAMIKEAIYFGKQAKGDPSCYPLVSQQPPQITACVTTPFSRIAGAANRATQKYEPFTESEVTADMLAPELRLHVYPVHDGRPPRPVSPEKVILRLKGSTDLADVTHPIRTEVLTESYKNAYGASWVGQSLVASFPLSALTDVVEIRIVFMEPVCWDKKAKSYGINCGVELLGAVRKLMR